MKVCLTNDVEAYSGDYEAEVFAGGLGLAYLVETCRRHGARATHFVEALGATRWGREPLRRICGMLRDGEQDVQLHVHPVVAAIPGFEDQDDVFCLRDLRTQEMLLDVGLRELSACGVDDVKAFRAGDLAASHDTLAAMKAVGLSISANRDLDRKSSIRSRLNDAFPVRNDLSQLDGILDVPVTAIESALPRLDGTCRHFEIAAMGLREMCDALVKLQAAGYTCVGVLMHPREFFRIRRGVPVPIRKNCRRLEGLLRFVEAQPDMAFVAVDELPGCCPVPEVSPPLVRGGLPATLLRVAEQGVDRVVARL